MLLQNFEAKKDLILNGGIDHEELHSIIAGYLLLVDHIFPDICLSQKMIIQSMIQLSTKFNIAHT